MGLPRGGVHQGRLASVVRCVTWSRSYLTYPATLVIFRCPELDSCLASHLSDLATVLSDWLSTLAVLFLRLGFVEGFWV